MKFLFNNTKRIVENIKIELFYFITFMINVNNIVYITCIQTLSIVIINRMIELIHI